MSFNQLNDDKKQTYNIHLHNNKFGWDVQANKHGKSD